MFGTRVNLELLIISKWLPVMISITHIIPYKIYNSRPYDFLQKIVPMNDTMNAGVCGSSDTDKLLVCIEC